MVAQKHRTDSVDHRPQRLGRKTADPARAQTPGVAAELAGIVSRHPFESVGLSLLAGFATARWMPAKMQRNLLMQAGQLLLAEAVKRRRQQEAIQAAWRHDAERE